MPTSTESAELRAGSELARDHRGEFDRGDGHALPAGPKGFFTDTTVCIGCKACEVACKQWNQLPDDGFVFTGTSYDNTGDLGSSTWRHVAFIERPGAHPTTGFADMSWFEGDDAPSAPVAFGPDPQGGGDFSWLMLSDVCKHCVHAGCLDVCPTGAIIRTEYESVYIQPDVCNGCGMCVPACPFGVVDRREEDGRAWKCTLCYDRQRDGLEPACAKACPTDSIVFGDIDDLRAIAEERVATLHERGVDSAYLYGADAASQPGTQGLNAFFLLTDAPEVYNLPPDPVDPTHAVGAAWRSALVAGAAMVVAVAGAVLSAAGARR
ncbi:MAG: 4Fe-4S dicluster domain-containing protein [Actinobacteria bacterium]|nr:4Fe-4S dicluster domain-containing protein [Actinomycetota bacterium]